MWHPDRKTHVVGFNKRKLVKKIVKRLAVLYGKKAKKEKKLTRSSMDLNVMILTKNFWGKKKYAEEKSSQKTTKSA